MTRFTAIAGMVLCAMTLPAAGDTTATGQVMFSTRVEAVRVDVLVTEGGKPVPGLRAADFVVLDNGMEQRVNLMSSEKIPLNVTLVLDASESVVGERLVHLQAASAGVLDGLAAGDRAALITFSDNLAFPAPPTSNLAALRAALQQLNPGGQTRLFDAAYAGIIVGEAEGLRGLLIVFTDGNDTGSFLRRNQVLDVASRSDVVIYSVAALQPGATGPPAFLRDVTSQTGGTLFEVKSTSELSAVFARILEEFRRRYLLSYSPAGVSADGWHTIEVRVKGRRGLAIKARQGYYR